MKFSFLAIASLVLMATTGNAQQTPATSVLQNPAGTATPHEVFTENDVINVVMTQGAAAIAFSAPTMVNVATLCENTANPNVKMTVQIGTGLPVTVKDFDVFVAGKDSGFNCPLPATAAIQGFDVSDIETYWKMHRGHGKNEFTQEDLRAVLNKIRSQPAGEILTRNDVPRGYWGNDLPHIMDVVNDSYGQPTGWVVNSTGEFYMVVHNACVTICEGKRPFSVYHLHPPKKSKPPRKTVHRHPKPPVVVIPRPLPREIPMVCGNC